MKVPLDYCTIYFWCTFDRETWTFLHVDFYVVINRGSCQKILIRPTKTTCITAKRKYPSCLKSMSIKPKIRNQSVKCNIFESHMHSPLNSFLYLKSLELKDSLRKKILEKAAHIKSRAKTRNKNSREENVAWVSQDVLWTRHFLRLRCFQIMVVSWFFAQCYPTTVIFLNYGVF